MTKLRNLKIFPLKDDPKDAWLIADESARFNADDATFVKSILPMYFGTVKSAISNNNWLSILLS